MGQDVKTPISESFSDAMSGEMSPARNIVMEIVNRGLADKQEARKIASIAKKIEEKIEGMEFLQVYSIYDHIALDFKTAVFEEEDYIKIKRIIRGYGYKVRFTVFSEKYAEPFTVFIRLWLRKR
jgi:hypothetical protein